MKRIQAKNGFMLVKTGIEESGLPFIVITSAISGPDNSDFSDWKELPEQEALELQEKYNTDEYNHSNRDKNIKSTNTGSGESNIPDNYIFRITEDPTELSNNLNLAANILFEKCVSVKLIGTLNNIEYNLIGTYCNGYITSPSENSILVFNVDFNNGDITLFTTYNLNQILPYIPLEIGDSDEVKSKNKKNLSIGGHFFTQIDYGFGVGIYNSANGGFAHITTAYGNEVFYNISSDGAVSKK